MVSELASQRGATMAEVLVTTGIMVALAFIAVPSLSTLRQETGIVSAQREIMTALYVARSGAIASNTARSVIFTPPTQIQIKNQAGTTTYYTSNLNSYGPGISLAGSTAVTVTFDARGLLTNNSAVTLTINNTKNQSKTVSVSLTGKPTAS